MLREIARQCLDQLRTTDTVGRYRQAEESEGIIGRLGGEEFVILLPETQLKQALIMAERIRESIEKMIVPAPGGHAEAGTIRVTMSIGVSTLYPEKDNLNDVLTRADHALYTAKEMGRNRVCESIQ